MILPSPSFCNFLVPLLFFLFLFFLFQRSGKIRKMTRVDLLFFFLLEELVVVRKMISQPRIPSALPPTPSSPAPSLFFLFPFLFLPGRKGVDHYGRTRGPDRRVRKVALAVFSRPLVPAIGYFLFSFFFFLLSPARVTSDR